LPTLRYLFIGAEKLTYDLVERSLASVSEKCRVFNMYGPTEATIISAVLELDREGYREFKRLSGIPIGKPVANLRLFVLDNNFRLCPVNVAGELYIAGRGVASGYLNRPKLTKDSFVSFASGPTAFPSPGGVPEGRGGLEYGVKRSDTHHSGLLYKTGDLARWLPDGNIEFLGRKDSQVKIRGFRIEPGEIENRLLEHERVKEAIVIDFSTSEGEKYLCAYIVAKSTESETGHSGPIHQTLRTVETQNLASQPEEIPSPGFRGAAPRMAVGRGGLSPSDLRRFLAHNLPNYMIPSHFIFIDNIPLNPNGKVDRNALPDPGSAGLYPEENFVAPRNQLEESITRIWQEVLGLSRVGINDNFFDIGGNSLNVIRVGAKMKQELGISIPLVTMFRYTTVSGLVNYLSSQDRDEPIIRETVDREDRVYEGKKRRLQKINRRRSEING
jgi:acyl-CoA synthetase (AMP-forming)/AMP-acid ligase II/acyl carrier protein